MDGKTPMCSQRTRGEMVINSMRGDVPVVTVRPSAIESTFKDPFPGWIE